MNEDDKQLAAIHSLIAYGQKLEELGILTPTEETELNEFYSKWRDLVPSLSDEDQAGMESTAWVREQQDALKAGELEPWKIDKLDATLPGWRTDDFALYF